MTSSDKKFLVRFGVAMPSGLLEQFDTCLKKQELSNRSTALRQLVRDYISSIKWHEGDAEVCGSITLMYNHHLKDISEELTKLQHNYTDVIICTNHVHISHEICLECLAVKGNAAKLKELEKKLKAVKGIHSVNTAIMLKD